jgi:hypothetical protein
MVLPLMLGVVFLLRSETCLAKVVFVLMPEFVQVFVKVGGLFGQGGFCLDA